MQNYARLAYIVSTRVPMPLHLRNQRHSTNAVIIIIIIIIITDLCQTFIKYRGVSRLHNKRFQL